jgi:hypothetical protein
MSEGASDSICAECGQQYGGEAEAELPERLPPRKAIFRQGF